MTLPTAHTVLHESDAKAHDLVTLTYEERFLRRKVLTTVHDQRFLVDLEHTISVDHGSLFQLDDGRLIEVIAAEENLLQVTGADLPRLAWHIGNRHTPCQIEDGRLLIQRDHVIMAMLSHLGANVTEVCEPFTPEGGAYGHGRTHSHDHGKTLHSHSRDQGHHHHHDH
ncbi:urease accessory protein UreE [Thalassovita sp.]|uniref:urease accessory protein UreE n=1 Tax=Thalassovita sp. TaxID=1979401 RepID=UPI0029DE8996|nr:urease accessory protein UreE [Thalassovita sp.]